MLQLEIAGVNVARVAQIATSFEVIGSKVKVKGSTYRCPHVQRSTFLSSPSLFLPLPIPSAGVPFPLIPSILTLNLSSSPCLFPAQLPAHASLPYITSEVSGHADPFPSQVFVPISMGIARDRDTHGTSHAFFNSTITPSAGSYTST